MEGKNKKKIVLSIIGIVTALLITLGITYAVFTYTKKGNTENTITTGKLTFLYTENTGTGTGINITNAFPVSDEIGKAYIGDNSVFDFKVESEIVGDMSIPYEVTVGKTNDSTLDEQYIKLYLTDTTEIIEEELMEATRYSRLPKSSVESTEKQIYFDEVEANENYLKNFRLRMWIADTNADENPTNQEEINDKTFTLKVNVYSNENVIKKKIVKRPSYDLETLELFSVTEDGVLSVNYISDYDEEQFDEDVMQWAIDHNYPNYEDYDDDEAYEEAYYKWMDEVGYPNFEDYKYDNADAARPKTLVIPSEVNGIQVKEISRFSNRCLDYVESVIISDGITKINSGTFNYWTGLRNLTIPDSVTYIGELEINSVYLRLLIIPDSVTYIGSIGGNLTHIQYNGPAVDRENNNWRTASRNAYIDGNFIYADSSKEKLIGYYGNDRDVQIPNGVKIIGNRSFSYDNINSIYIPDSVVKIENEAFDSSYLNEIVVPDSVTNIESYAFRNVHHIIYNGSAVDVDNDNWGAESRN